MVLVAKPVMAFMVLPDHQTRSTCIKVIWPLVVTVLEFMLWPQVVGVEMAVPIRMQIVTDTTLQTAFLVVLLPRLTLGLSTALFHLQLSLLLEFMQFLAEAMAEMVAEIIRMVMRVSGVMAHLAVQCMYQIPLHS
ncbi:hypothetical protein DN92_03390 [Polynucleobacter arcticus]|uniref:Uncharacterized protein n=1 Tax=Polynucleobacter arcticus TaxID=1743165 RepID=A0A6M9PIC9_9BURK|nr:hypothetical protein DN92_03390 [Polynucleobacter arcticus]